MSECDHKCEIRNAEPEIGTDGSSQTLRNPWVDGYRSPFEPPRVSGSGVWTGLEPNRPVFPVQTQTTSGFPGPVANTSGNTKQTAVSKLKTISVRARTPAFGLVGIRMVIIGIRLQTWMRVIVGVDV